MKIGVLALQGDVVEHVNVLNNIGIDPILVKSPANLAAVEAIIIPGGESTTMSLLLGSAGLADPLKRALDDGMPAFGTCAGMIMLAGTILDGREDQISFSKIDISVRRNGFGRQVASFETDLAVQGILGPPMRAVFIRAPVVEWASDEVEILATVKYHFADSSMREVPVICKQGNVLVSSFHPEIVGDDRLHALFVELL